MSTTDLEGKTFLVTGANTGIGRATAVDLARRGGRVHLACRSEEKTKPVLDEIGDAATFLPLDLGDLASVHACAEEFLARDESLHVLVNNAGLAGQRGLTTSGFELAFGVNHVGHFLLTNLLLDRLKASAPARIVNVSSVGHYQAKGIDYEAVRKPTKSVTGLPEYAVSKLANVVHAQELARRLEGSGVTTYSLHPGAIASDVWRRIPWPVAPIMKLFMKNTEEGAQTSLYCATDPALAGVSGRYYDDRAEKEPNKLATPELGAELWKNSEEWTA
jgi:NAD(P)-dependent dehydrogenase (short-subunit alcohol dehydrogenase family)